MAVTIYDLAAAANVSISTVSKALNDCYYVSDETRRRVQELAAEMDYRPNARARSFAQKKTARCFLPQIFPAVWDLKTRICLRSLPA